MTVSESESDKIEREEYDKSGMTYNCPLGDMVLIYMVLDSTIGPRKGAAAAVCAV